MTPETRDLLLDALAASAVILSPLLLAIGLLAVRYLAKATKFKNVQILEWGVRQAILVIEEASTKRVIGAEERKKLAREKARDLSPDKLRPYNDAKVDDVIEAQLTLLKPSIRPPAGPTLSLRPPTFSIPPLPDTGLFEEDRLR